MNLYRITYLRNGQPATFVYTALGIVSAIEFGAKVAASWHLVAWQVKRINFRRAAK